MILYSIPLLALSLLVIVVLSERVIRYVLVLSTLFGLSEMLLYLKVHLSIGKPIIK